MKTINTTQVLDPSVLQPFTARSLRFLQESKEDDVAAIIKAIVTSNIGSYSLTTPYVISGCIVSSGGFVVTAGEVFFGGKYYQTTAVTGTSYVAKYILTKSQDATADPVIFSDSSSKNVHDIYKYVPTDVSTGGDFTANDLVNLYGSTTIQTSTSAQDTIEVNIVSSGPFAYAADSYDYAWYIEKGICFLNFTVTFDVTDGAVVDKIHLPLPVGLTKSLTLTEPQAFRGIASYYAPTSSTDYMLMQVNSNDDGTEGQRITLKRYVNGSVDIGLSTGSTILIKGSVQFLLA